MLQIAGISKTFPGATSLALDDVTLDCENGSFTTLLGPSGCGKSTLLRCVAGLETPEAGSITLGGNTLVDMRLGVELPAHRRGIGMVFQSYAIWPHMTVARNVGYPLKIRGDTDRDVSGAVREVLEMVGLKDFGSRSSSDLSGGQQQRVAIARAVVHRPSLLLLDEPMSNLDAHLRRRLGAQLRELQRRLKLTVVYVTHDRDEALTLSDRIVVMSEGRMVDGGTPTGLYSRPCSDRGALSVGEANFLPAVLSGAVATSTAFDPPLSCETNAVSADETAILLRPEWIDVHPEAGVPLPDPAVPKASATVREVIFRGMMTELELELEDGSPLLVRLRRPLDLAAGDRVLLTVPSNLPVTVARVSVDPAADDKPDETSEKQGVTIPQARRRLATLLKRKPETTT